MFQLNTIAIPSDDMAFWAEASHEACAFPIFQIVGADEEIAIDTTVRRKGSK